MGRFKRSWEFEDLWNGVKRVYQAANDWCDDNSAACAAATLLPYGRAAKAGGQLVKYCVNVIRKWFPRKRRHSDRLGDDICPQSLFLLFKSLDRDSNGYLDYTELRIINATMGTELADDYLLRKDANVNGVIDPPEFAECMSEESLGMYNRKRKRDVCYY